jgi:hypothetical protein
MAIADYQKDKDLNLLYPMIVRKLVDGYKFKEALF